MTPRQGSCREPGPRSRAPGRALPLLLCLLSLAVPEAAAAPRDDVLRLRGQALAAEGRCEEALEATAEADPQDPGIALLRGECQLSLRRYPEAADTLAAARPDPDLDARLALARGVALYHLGDLQAAEASLQQARPAAEADPESLDTARLDLYTGLLALQRSEVREAALSLERARRAGPERMDPIASYYAGLAWQAANERGRAREALERVIERDPDGPWGEEARKALRGRRPPVAEGRPWALVRAGIEYDDNVVLRNDDVALPNEISDDEDFRGVWYAEVGSELFRTDDWSGGAFVSYEGNAHFEVTEFDLHYPVASGWLEGRLGRDTRALTRIDTGYAWLDELPYVFTLDVSETLQHGWGRLGETSFYTGLRWENYFVLEELRDPATGIRLEENSRLDRDGLRWRTGALHYNAWADRRVVSRVGVQIERNWTEGTDYDVTTGQVLAGASGLLGLGVNFDTEILYALEGYDNISFFDEERGEADSDPTDPRVDQRLEWRAALFREIVPNLVATAEYRGTRVFSQIDVFDYQRHVVGLTFTVTLGAPRAF